MTLEHVGIVFQIVIFLFAISVHESAHAWMALRNGDPTAYMLGRVTLNPIKHIDPIGTVLLPAIAMFTGFPMIGWAKPTPVNPRNFKNVVRSDILTSVAGPISNLLIAAGAVLVLIVISFALPGGRMIVHSLAHGRDPQTNSALMPLCLLLYWTMQLNVLLAIFNLIPIPPLDGSHVLRHFLPEPVRRTYDYAGVFGLIAIMLLGGQFLGRLLFPVIRTVNSLLARI